MQNTLQNAGHRRSSSAARRSSASRRHSSAAGISDDDPNKMRLQWDEANLYLAEQEAGGRMKITEPKTPYQYGDGGAMEEEDEEDVAIDPRFVHVDEVEMAKNKTTKKHRESEIPGLDIGEPEDETGDVGQESDRIVRSGSASLSREGSKEKHVSVSGEGGGATEQVGMPTSEEQEKHRKFEEQRKKHYEMGNVKNLLGYVTLPPAAYATADNAISHPEDIDEEEEEPVPATVPALPNRGINGTR